MARCHHSRSFIQTSSSYRVRKVNNFFGISLTNIAIKVFTPSDAAIQRGVTASKAYCGHFVFHISRKTILVVSQVKTNGLFLYSLGSPKSANTKISVSN